MLRAVLCVLIWIVFVGGLGYYMQQRPAGHTAIDSEIVLDDAQGRFALVVTPTFAVEPDPFALQVDESEAPAALVVRLGPQEVLRQTDRLQAGRPIRIAPLDGVVAGINEIYLAASPPVAEGAQNHAVRVQIFRDGQIVGQETFWSAEGATVSGTLRFTAKALHSQEQDHGHP